MAGTSVARVKARAPSQPRWTRTATAGIAAKPKSTAAMIKKTSCTGVMPAGYPGEVIDMSAMLGRSGAWFYGYRWANRTMRRSGRQRERRAAALEVRDELADVHPVQLHSWSCSICRPAWPYDEEPKFHGE